MPKPRKTLTVRLPRFVPGATPWRRLVHDAAALAQQRSRVEDARDDKLAIEVRLGLPMSKKRLQRVDVDNRLKHIMDALQGLLAGEGSKHRTKPVIIPNDAQVYRASIEKRLQSTKLKASGGTLKIRFLSRVK